MNRVDRIYESHITVNMPRNEFLAICRDNSLKPIHITEDTGSSHEQFMTARFHRCEDDDIAILNANLIAEKFKKRVTRTKVELILGKSDEIPKKHLYLEFHAKFLLFSGEEQKFRDVAAEAGLHTARNALKSSWYRFATSRSEAAIRQGIDKLVAAKFRLMSLIRECVVYDSNPSVDDLWVCDCPLKERMKGITA